MSMHLAMTVGANTFDLQGDVPFEQVIELARLWFAAVSPDASEQARIAALSARVQAQYQAIRAATAADSPN